jgi:hypothetical protein
MEDNTDIDFLKIYIKMLFTFVLYDSKQGEHS